MQPESTANPVSIAREPLRTHIDYTTLYGAALAIDCQQLDEPGIPFGRIICLGQVLEAIVLHEAPQFELGSTKDWAKYRDALEGSSIGRAVVAKRVCLLPCEDQIDADEAVIVRAVQDAIARSRAVHPAELTWAVRLRSGTYEPLPEKDAENPLILRYLEVVRDQGDKDLNKQLNTAIVRLKNAGVGLLGLHVLTRLELMRHAWVDTGKAHYYPHFSRQPLVTGSADQSPQSWTMDKLKAKREELLSLAARRRSTDEMAQRLSPVFLACLKNARSPEDLLDNAMTLRDGIEVRNYRQRAATALASSIREDDRGPSDAWQETLQPLIMDTVHYLFGKNDSQLRFERHWCVYVGRVLPMACGAAWRRMWRGRFNGDKAAIFLSDLLDMSLGIHTVRDRIAEVFGKPLIDHEIMSCTAPGPGQPVP